MSKSITIRVPAAQFADEDDCLAAAAAKVAAERGLDGWDLSPRWADEQRDEILLDVPAESWIIEGRGEDGRWSREYVEAGGDAEFGTSAEAEAAIGDLARIGFDPADLRVRRQDTVSNVPAVKRRWLSVKIDRHADFGGGAIVADIPDTEYHRRFYADRIVRVWSQLVESE